MGSNRRRSRRGSALRHGGVGGNSVWAVVPLGTLDVNVIGSLAISLITTALLARGADPAFRYLLVTGILGGYTTFSAFSFETLVLIETGRWNMAARSAIGSVVLGLAACGLGLVVGRPIVRYRAGAPPCRADAGGTTAFHVEPISR